MFTGEAVEVPLELVAEIVPTISASRFKPYVSLKTDIGIVHERVLNTTE